MGFVLLDDRHLRSDPEEAPDRVLLHDEVVVELEPVLHEMLLEPFVLERIHHREHFAAAPQIRIEGFELRREQVVARPGEDDDHRVVRHLASAREDQGLHVVVGLLHRRLRFAEPRPIAVPELVLAVPLDHIDDALALTGDLDEAVRQLLLFGVEHLFRLRLGLEHDRPVRFDPVAAGEAGLTVGVDAPPRELPVRVARILLEQVLGHALAGLVAAVEGDRAHLGLEPAEKLHGLGREAEPLVLGEVPAGTVPERQRLDDDGRAQHQRDRHRGVQAVSHRPAAEEAAEVLDPREQGRQHEQHAGGDERPAEPRPLRPQERQDRRRHQHDEAAVAAPVEKPPDHPLHRRASRDRSVRNNASTVKLR